MIYILYPYRKVKPWFCEWTSTYQPKLIRHMCFALSYKREGVANVSPIFGKAVVYVEGLNDATIMPKFKMHSTWSGWFKGMFKNIRG